MSRIGKKIITIPENVEVTIEDSVIKVKGPKGELKQQINPLVTIEKTKEGLKLSVAKENNKKERAIWGLFGSLVLNMVIGVTQGYKKQLEINGVGYKVVPKGNDLLLHVGFSHPVDFKVPQDVTATVNENIITIEGKDKQIVGETAAQIREIKKPEPYKGKGIKYVDEIILRKAGKAATS